MLRLDVGYTVLFLLHLSEFMRSTRDLMRIWYAALDITDRYSRRLAQIVLERVTDANISLM